MAMVRNVTAEATIKPNIAERTSTGEYRQKVKRRGRPILATVTEGQVSVVKDLPLKVSVGRRM